VRLSFGDNARSGPAPASNRIRQPRQPIGHRYGRSHPFAAISNGHCRAASLCRCWLRRARSGGRNRCSPAGGRLPGRQRKHHDHCRDPRRGERQRLVQERTHRRRPAGLGTRRAHRVVDPPLPIRHAGHRPGIRSLRRPCLRITVTHTRALDLIGADREIRAAAGRPGNSRRGERDQPAWLGYRDRHSSGDWCHGSSSGPPDNAHQIPATYVPVLVTERQPPAARPCTRAGLRYPVRGHGMAIGASTFHGGDDYDRRNGTSRGLRRCR
jgi:hypothetical protein